MKHNYLVDVNIKKRPDFSSISGGLTVAPFSKLWVFGAMWFYQI